LHSIATTVPWSRVVREHRAALVPLALALAINVGLLAVVVLPLSRRVAANEQRTDRATREQVLAAAEFRQAEAVREGKSRASVDLQTFYKDVLPADVAAARRVVQSTIKGLAAANHVHYERSSADAQEIKGSELERLTTSMTLTGSYDNIRAFLYELETAPEFVVIDNMVLAEGFDQNSPLSLSVELSTYYRAPAAQKTSAPRGTGTGTNGR